MDDGLLGKPVDDQVTDDGDKQAKIDEALDKLPDDLEKPVMTPEKPEITKSDEPEIKPSPSAELDKELPSLPPLPETEPQVSGKPDKDEVKPENPEEIKTPKGMGGKTKKRIKKMAGGLVMVLLIMGGLFIGRQAVQERQVVEKDAYVPPSSVWLKPGNINPGDIPFGGRCDFVECTRGDTDGDLHCTMKDSGSKYQKLRP